MQVNEPLLLMQVAPFSHGELKHSSISISLRIDGICNVKIDSFNNTECGMISIMNDHDDGVNIVIIGLVGGVLATLIIAVSLVVVAVVLLLVRTRKKKASQEVDNRDVVDIYE